MKVSIWSDGDRSVGINGFSASVDIGDFLTDNEDMREDTRDRLAYCFSELWDETAHVMFENEIDDDEEFTMEEFEPQICSKERSEAIHKWMYGT